MKLNGWQRLGVVGSLILAIPVAVGTWLMLPSDEAIKEAWANAALRSITQFYDSRPWVSPSQVKIVLFYGLDHDATIEGARKYAQESHDRQLKANPKAVPSMLLEMMVADDNSNEAMSRLWRERHKVVAIGAGVWLATILLAYAIALSVVWIRRGFQPQ